MLNSNVMKHLETLVSRYPELDVCKDSIANAYLILDSEKQEFPDAS